MSEERFSEATYTKGTRMEVQYDTVVEYSKIETLAFKDFSMSFLGINTIIPSANKNLALITYKFRIWNSAETKEINWSSGTGSIDQTEFSIGNKKFELEMAYSEKYSWISMDKLVVKQ